MPVHLDEEEEDFEDVVDLETISDVNTRIGESQKTPSACSDFSGKSKQTMDLLLCRRYPLFVSLVCRPRSGRFGWIDVCEYAGNNVCRTVSSAFPVW